MMRIIVYSIPHGKIHLEYLQNNRKLLFLFFLYIAIILSIPLSNLIFLLFSLHPVILLFSLILEINGIYLEQIDKLLVYSSCGSRQDRMLSSSRLLLRSLRGAVARAGAATRADTASNAPAIFLPASARLG